MQVRINTKQKKENKKKSKLEKKISKKVPSVCSKEVFSQLRQDLITGDWTVIASDRGKRPFDEREVPTAWNLNEIPSEEDCLFCDPEASGQEKDTLIYLTSSNEWTLRVFPNKYPAFSRPKTKRVRHEEDGPYFWMEGVGYHELFVTHDHCKHIGQLDRLMVAEVLDAYQSRYLDLMNRKSVRYIEIFHNHGPAAGASIFHPHSQLLAIPVISPYIKLELNGARDYYKSNRKCVYCVMLEWELEEQKRVIFEDDDFVAFCPFASRSAFEVWVMPKKHQPYFERISDEEKISCASALKESLRKIAKVLGEPAYNFYLHTSPCDGSDYPYYHWHIEILPKTSIWAGFELSTGIEVSTIQPEDAAKKLKEA